jgi:hypothetical protein
MAADEPGPAGDKDTLAHIRFLARGCLTKPVQHLEGARVTQRRASGSFCRHEGRRFRGGCWVGVGAWVDDEGGC